jgi:hypothetical protein
MGGSSLDLLKCAGWRLMLSANGCGSQVQTRFGGKGSACCERIFAAHGVEAVLRLKVCCHAGGGGNGFGLVRN